MFWTKSGLRHHGARAAPLNGTGARRGDRGDQLFAAMQNAAEAAVVEALER